VSFLLRELTRENGGGTLTDMITKERMQDDQDDADQANPDADEDEEGGGGTRGEGGKGDELAEAAETTGAAGAGAGAAGAGAAGAVGADEAKAAAAAQAMMEAGAGGVEAHGAEATRDLAEPAGATVTCFLRQPEVDRARGRLALDLRNPRHIAVLRDPMRRAERVLRTGTAAATTAAGVAGTGLVVTAAVAAGQQ
jgi:hypothetical protein